jgi:hypothetical protein
MLVKAPHKGFTFINNLKNEDHLMELLTKRPVYSIRHKNPSYNLDRKY